jgi:hypothetical protein
VTRTRHNAEYARHTLAFPWHVQSRKVNLLLIPRFRVRLPARAPTCSVTESQRVSMQCLASQSRMRRSAEVAIDTLFDTLTVENSPANGGGTGPV